MRSSPTLLAGAAAFALLASALTARAQDVRPLEPPRLNADVQVPTTFGEFTGIIGQPLGQFHDNVAIAGGGELGISHQFGRNRVFGLRGSMGMMLYGYESQQVPFNDAYGRVQLDLTTTNNIFLMQVGPTLVAPSGSVRPYADAGIGLSYFFTSSKLQGTSNSEPFAQTENYHAGRLAWNGGAGVLIPIGPARSNAMLDIGARYLRNGRTSYLAKGDVHDDGTGGYYTTPHETDANLVLYHIGVRLGITRNNLTFAQ